jgi:hypothetical protein
MDPSIHQSLPETQRAVGDVRPHCSFGLRPAPTGANRIGTSAESVRGVRCGSAGLLEGRRRLREVGRLVQHLRVRIAGEFELGAQLVDRGRGDGQRLMLLGGQPNATRT